MVWPGSPNDALDKGLTGFVAQASELGRRGKHHNVAPVGGLPAVANFFDQQAIANVQRRIHGVGGDIAGFGDQHPHRQGDRQRDRQHPQVAPLAMPQQSPPPPSNGL
jgi:hypothetical protein